MKTPIQQLIDELNQQIDLLIEKQFEVEWRLEDIRFQSYYDGTTKSLMDVESKLKTHYLEKEKDLIVASYYYGWHDGNNYIDTMPKTGFEPKPLYKDGEDYYKKTFEIKHK